MKIIFGAVIGLLLASAAFADRGIVVKEHDDKYVIEYNQGYLLVEWYRGHIPSEGCKYVGKFNSYGFRDLYCISCEEETHFWVEDYMVGIDEAMEYLYDE